MRIRLRHASVQTVVLLLCLLLCAPAAPAALAAPPAPAAATTDAGPERYDTLDRYIRARMKATRTPGLSYAVVGPGGPLHQRSWGTDGRGERVTARTPFLWGSVAKPATASAVMVLVQEGRLRLDDRVVDHLPDFRFGGRAHAAKVTLRHLLGQTAGIPEAAALRVTECFDADCPRPGERVRALDEVEPLGRPGTEYAYSSANYVLLAAVVESVTGRPFAEQLRETVLDPAGMDGAIADRASARKRKLAPGHQLMWGIPTANADGVDGHGASYGYLGGDLTDLAAFAAFQLRSGRTAGGDAVLTRESVRLMRQEGTLRPGGEGTGYGLGWRVGGLDAPLEDAVWHTGGAPGYSAMLFLLPGQNRALVLEQNLYGLLQDDAIMQIGFDAARILADGRARSVDGASATPYYLAVWSVTALALLLVLTAARSAWLLRRRPAGTASALRRTTGTVLWCLLGLLPSALLLLVEDRMGLGQLRNWVPDAFLAVTVAAGAGGVTVLLRLLLAVLAARGVRAERAGAARAGVAAEAVTRPPVPSGTGGGSGSGDEDGDDDSDGRVP